MIRHAPGIRFFPADPTFPLYVDTDLEYDAADLGVPFRDLLSEGVIGASDLLVSQRAAGANMSVDVAAGACYVLGDTDPLTQPNYRCRFPSVTNLVVGAAHGTLPRIDRVVAEVLDAAFAGASRLRRLRVISGTATAGATLANLNGAAAVPATALLLANVLVPAAATSIVNANIGDVRTRATVGSGGAAIVGSTIYRNTTEIDVVNTGAETAILSQVIAGGAMGTNKLLRATIIGDYKQGVSGNYVLRLKFGGTTWVQTLANNHGINGDRYAFKHEIVIGNLGSASSQFLNWAVRMSNSGGGAGIGLGDASWTMAVDSMFGNETAMAIDTSADQTLEVSVDFDTVDPNLSYRKKYAIVEIV